MTDCTKSFSTILRLYFDSYSDIPLVMLDADHRVMYCNKAFRKQIELSKSPCGTSIHDMLDIEIDLSDPLDRDEESGAAADIAAGTYNQNGIRKTLKGHIFSHEELFVIIFDILERHNIDIIEKISRLNLEMTSMTRDYSKQNRILDRRSREMEREAKIDPLTKLWNRRYLSETLTRILTETDDQGNPLKFGIMMFDIDDFKRYNDTCGHETGDRVLQLFAEELQSRIRKEDAAARFGGEEFVVIFYDITLEQLKTIAEKIRQAFSMIHIDGVDQPVTASFGITVRKKRDTQNSLLKRADDALYEAKRSGKNCVSTR